MNTEELFQLDLKAAVSAVAAAVSEVSRCLLLPLLPLPPLKNLRLKYWSWSQNLNLPPNLCFDLDRTVNRLNCYLWSWCYCCCKCRKGYSTAMAGKGLWHLWQGTETIVGGRSMTMWKKKVGRWSGPLGLWWSGLVRKDLNLLGSLAYYPVGM